MNHARCALNFAFWNMVKVLGVGLVISAVVIFTVANNG